LPVRPVLEHGQTTTHLWITAEARRVLRAGRSTRPNRAAVGLGLGKTPLDGDVRTRPVAANEHSENPA
jgi:hypothetical protein